MIKWSNVLFGIVMLISCQSTQVTSLDTTELDLTTSHSGEPNLTVGQDGRMFLSWVEYANDSLDVLQFSKLEKEKWSKPKMISQGYDWFVNWADFPSFVSIDQSFYMAHWLQKSADGTYDYDIRISHSKDGGENWSPSIIPHKDGINAEHGFVSMIPTPDGKTFAVWLDGRNTKKDNAMTLRCAEIDRKGEITEEVELDRRVCDCCQTGATWTEKGPIVVYRDRSMDEVRDIGIVRRINNEWTAPKPLFDDKWKIAGCPVNGPSIDSKDNVVVVAWFTMAQDQPKVLCTISKDYGASFCDPIVIDDQSPIGRVDAIVHNDEAWVLWMSEDKEMANINLVSLSYDGELSEIQKVGNNSSSRSSGFPRIESKDDGIIMAWTDAKDSIKIVRTFKIEIDHE